VLDVGLTSDSRFATGAAFLERTARVVARARASQPKPPPAGSERRWTPVSGGRSSNAAAILPSVALSGASVVVASRSSDDKAEAVTFSPSVARDAVRVRRDPIAGASTSLGNPHLLPRAGGGLQVLLDGIPPFGVSFASRNGDGSYAAPVTAVANNPRATAAGPAVLTDDGVPVWGAGYGGQLWVWRGARGVSLESVLPAGSGGAATPTLGRDRAGRLWIAWNLVASPGRRDLGGLYLARLDPATLGLIGEPMHAPGSERPGVSSIALACAETCRLVYEQLGASGTRIVSWAASERAPTLVTRLKGDRAVARVTASYTASRRLWVAWWDSAARVFDAKLGSSTGAGETIATIGRPSADGTPGLAASVAVGNDLVLVVNWLSGGARSARYVNVVSGR
jgi:hypothetical protein